MLENQQSECSLVRLLREGSDVTFRDVYERHASALKARAYYFYRDEFLAEEAVQEVMTKLWQGRRELPKIESLSAYLHRAVINYCINQKNKDVTLEARKRLYAQILDTVSEVKPFARAELAKALADAINEISPTNRRSFELAYLEDMRTEDIAKVLGLKAADVRKRISRALLSLRRSLSHLKIF